MKLYNEAMNLWAAGGTTTSIADALGINRGTVSNILIRARREEDERAVPRKRGRKKNAE